MMLANNLPMKKLLLLLAVLSAFTLTGCDKDAFKPFNRDEYMTATFPGAKIYRATEANDLYLVERDGGITEFRVEGNALVRYVFVPINK